MNNTEAKKIMRHILSRQNHAKDNPDGSRSIVFTWKGEHQIATFHRTIDDLMEDTWSVQVNLLGSMDIIVHSTDPIQYDSVIPQDIDGDED